MHLSGWALPARQASILIFGLPRTPMLGGWLWSSIARSLAPELVRRVFAPNPVPAAFEAGFPIEMALRPAQLLADAEDLRSLNPCVARMRERYAAIAVPVEVVSGAADLVAEPGRHAVPLAALLPDARLTLIDGVGHMPHHIAPAAVMEAIDRAAARRG